MAIILEGAETRVNTFTADEQNNPQVAALEDGGWVVTWQSDGQDGSANGVYSQVYDASGARLGSETRVNDYTTGNQFGSQVAALEGGGWIVTWMSDGQDGSSYGVYSQAYSASGAKLGSETRVNDYTTGYQTDQQVTALVGGGWVVTWVSIGQDGSSYGVYQQVYSASGIKLGGETRVNDFTSNAQFGQQVAALEGGGWVVTWVSEGQDGDAYGVYQEIYNADGLAIGGEAQVNTFTTNSQSNPSVTALTGGGWVVTWESEGQDGDTDGVYSQVYSALGVEVGGEIEVNLNTAGNQGNPQVTALESGGWVVTWQSFDQDGSGWGIYQQVFAANGNRVGGETQVNNFTTHNQSHPRVTSLEDGGWVVTWQSNGQDGSANGIYSQVYDASGVKLGGEIQVNEFTQNGQYNQRVVALADGGWVVTWASYGQDGDDYGVYQKVFRFNEAPSITSNGGGMSASIAIAENTLAVTTVTASDPDGQALTYAITGGADAGKFSIDAATGLLTFKTAPDFEAPGDAGGNNIYDVVVRVSDGDLSDTQALAVTVSDVVDVITGDGGSNTLTGASGIDVISGLGGKDELFGLAGDDMLVGGRGKDKLYGGPGDDTLKGGKGKDKLKGGTGKDKLVGGKGADKLDGGRGNDKLNGGKGKDKLDGGRGEDKMTGGGGGDKFVFKSVKDSPSKKKADVITDFRQKQDDVIVLKKIDAKAGVKGNQAFDFIGEDGFSGRKGELRFEAKKKNTFVYGDVDGDGKADFAIKLKGPIDLVKDDFVL